MNTDTTPQERAETNSASSAPRPLVRPGEGRSIAGVAAGLANYLNLSVGLIRFGFLFLVIFGGLGFVLYVAGWLLIRDETESESIASRVFSDLGNGGSWLGVAVIVLGAVIVLSEFTFLPGSLIWGAVLLTVGFLLYRGDIGPREPSGEVAAQEGPGSTIATEPRPPAGGATVPPAGGRPSAPPPPPAGPPTPPPPPSILGRLTIGVGLLALGVLAVVDNLTALIEPQPRHYMALALTVVGLGLLVGAFIGRARWMILLGIFLVPAVITSPLAEVDWENRLDIALAPVDVDDLQSSYQSPAGSYRFDFSETDWEGRDVELEVDLAVGEIVVVLPEDAEVTGSAQVGMGAVETPDGQQGGIGDIARTFTFDGEDGSLDLDLDVGVGAIRIYPADDAPPAFGASSRSTTFTERDNR